MEAGVDFVTLMPPPPKYAPRRPHHKRISNSERGPGVAECLCGCPVWWRLTFVSCHWPVTHSAIRAIGNVDFNLNSSKDVSCDRGGEGQKERKRGERRNISWPTRPALSHSHTHIHTHTHTHTHTHVKQSRRYTIKAFGKKCPSQKWWAGSLTVDYMVRDRLSVLKHYYMGSMLLISTSNAALSICQISRLYFPIGGSISLFEVSSCLCYSILTLKSIN